MAGEYINDEVFDQGLDYADTNGTRIDITSQVATTTPRQHPPIPWEIKPD